jgi:peptide/nickel transport system permease protein
MWSSVLQRLASLPGILLGVLLLVFVLVRLVPGGPAEAILGTSASAEQIAEVNHQLGLDRPLPAQFWDYLVHIGAGDFGTSLRNGRPVLELFLDRAGPTAQVIVLSMVLSLSVALVLGLAAAVRRDGVVDRIVSTLVPVGVSVPNFWLALLLALAFSVLLPVFPLFGLTLVRENPFEALRSSFLPAVAIGAFYTAVLVRATRASMIEVLDQPHVRTARAFGLSPTRVYLVYALKDAFIPVATLVGLQVRYSIGAAAVVEPIFAIPGLGRMLVDGILQRDYPVIQGTLLIMALALVLVNWLVDLVYIMLDPRTRS